MAEQRRFKHSPLTLTRSEDRGATPKTDGEREIIYKLLISIEHIIFELMYER